MRELISLVATVVAVLISLRFARSTMKGFTGVCVTIAIAASTWNQVKPLLFPLSDLLLLLSILPVAFALLRRKAQGRLPLLCVSGVLLVGLAILLNLVFPISQVFTESRYAADISLTKGMLVPTEGARIFNGLTAGIKLLVGLLVMPLALMTIAPDRRRLLALFDLWGISALVNAIVADVDATHLTHISLKLLGPVSGRQAGLTNHPNHLATVCVMAVPVVLSWWRRSPNWRRASLASLVILAMAINATGSRGGLAVGALIVVVGILAQPEVRRTVLPLAIPALLVVGAIMLLEPSFVHSLLSHTRFSSASGTDSDVVRAQVHRQAILDIKERPLFGIGFDIADQGHSIYLQAVAAGGVLTAAGIVLYMVGVARETWVRWSVEWRATATAALVSSLAWLVLGGIENDFADRYPYVPLAMLLAIAAVQVTTRAADPRSVPALPGPRRRELAQLV